MGPGADGRHRSVAKQMDVDQSPPSYEDLLKHHGIEPTHMQRQCSEEMIWALAPKMTGWRAIILGVDKGKIDAIEKDATDEEGKRHMYLNCWKQKLGHKATCERLTRVFIQSGRADLADAVCVEVKSMTVTTDRTDARKSGSGESAPGATAGRDNTSGPTTTGATAYADNSSTGACILSRIPATSTPLRYFQSNQESTSTTRDAGVNPETELTSDVGHEPQAPKGSEIETDARHESGTQDPSQTAMVSHEKTYKYISDEEPENKDAKFSVKHEKDELIDHLIHFLQKDYKQLRDDNSRLISLLVKEKDEKHAKTHELQEEIQLRIRKEEETEKQLEETTAKLKQLEQKAVFQLKEEQEQHKATKAILASKEQENAELRVRVEEKDEKLGEKREELKMLRELVEKIANTNFMLASYMHKTH